MTQINRSSKQNLEAFLQSCKALGKKIRDLRKKQNISQAQLAFESGIHREQIGRIELGKQNSSISILEAIADALGIRLNELLDFEY